MGDIFTAFLIYFALFIGTFICGYLPACIKATPETQNNIALFGGAMIVGMAIIVVLPEASSILINA